MKIGILANVPLDPNQGSGYVVCGYAKALRELGHTVVTRTSYPDKALPRGKGTAFRTRTGMLKSFALTKKSNVLLLWGGEAGWLVPKLNRMKSRGVIIACSNGLETHNALEQGANSTELAKFRAGACFRDLDGLMMVSKFDEDFAMAHGYQSEERRVAISNPLPSDFINRAQPIKDGRIVLFVGNWIRRKGSSTMIEMIRQTSEGANPPHFRLIGAGTAQAQEELNLPNVHAIDPGLKRSDLLKQYEEASILIMPSLYESFGMVATEAMACGCAVIATKTGFPYELVDQQEVLHVPFNDTRALSNALTRLTSDEELRLRLSSAGHHRVQNLTWENAGQEMDKFIHKILELGRR